MIMTIHGIQKQGQIDATDTSPSEPASEGVTGGLDSSGSLLPAPAVVAGGAGDIGAEIQFSRVLAIFGESGELLAGSQIGDRAISGTITANGRGKKVLVFKFKRKKQYKRTIGHRQDYTEVRVGDIAV